MKGVSLPVMASCQADRLLCAGCSRVAIRADGAVRPLKHAGTSIQGTGLGDRRGASPHRGYGFHPIRQKTPVVFDGEFADSRILAGLEVNCPKDVPR